VRKASKPISTTKSLRINERIRVPQVRLIDADGKHIGLVSIRDALQTARDQELDLVEVSPQADPPVCRVMDYGKYLYEQQKKEREARKAQKVIEVKEIRLRPKTNPHHRSFKVRDARRWLQADMKVKVRIRFRGREITYPEIARNDLIEIAEELKDVSSVEVHPNMEGRTMLMILAPLPKKGGGRSQAGAETVDLDEDEVEEIEDVEVADEEAPDDDTGNNEEEDE
jgi:translation initiation factor IF-3